MFNFFKKKEKRDVKTTLSAISEFLGMNGGSVQGDNAFKLVPVYSCIRYLADSIGMTTLTLYKKDKEDNRSESTTHPLAKWIKEPQQNTTMMNWFQAISGQLVGYGNAYALIVRDKRYQMTETVFVPTSSVSHQIANDGTVIYQLTINNKAYTVHPEDILHFKGISLDGNFGVSPIAYHRATLERSNSESDFGKKYYDNASSVGGVVTHPSRLTKEALADLRKNFSEQYGGVNNTGKTIILSEGMKYDRIEMISPTDANYVASKNLTDKDIANIFRVPIVLLNSTEASTYANVENLNLYFQMYSLNPLYRTIEQELNLKLTNESSKNHYFEFNPESLMNSTSTQKMEQLDKGIKGSFMTPNEARKRINMNPISGGDDLFIPLNSVPFSKYDSVMIDENAPSSTPKVAGQDNQNEEDRNSYIELEKRYNALSSKMGRLEKAIKNTSEK